MVSADPPRTDDGPCPRAVVKAAKRALKRRDSGGPMKIKSLARAVATEMDESARSSSGGSGDEDGTSGGVCVKSVRRLIEGSDKFSVEGKMVTLSNGTKKKKKKRKKDDAKIGAGSSGDEESPRKRRKTEKAEERGNGGGEEKVAAGGEGKGNGEGEGDGTASTSAWRKEHGVVLRDSRSNGGGSGDDAAPSASSDPSYHPLTTFESAGDVAAAPLLRRCVDVLKFDAPTPIQAQCWPVLLRDGSDGRRRDAVGIAETGSGKTLAFAVPALTEMYRDGDGKGRGRGRRTPRMLVLAPTRELAAQSHGVLKEFGADVGLTSAVVYGGVPKPRQRRELTAGVDCVVATPGRIRDLIDEGFVDLSGVKHLVLDEADRMLDMGFEEDVRYIIGTCAPKEDGRRTAMFSATWPPAIAKLAGEYMVDPVRVYVRKDAGGGGDDGDGGMVEEDGLTANRSVRQTVEVIDGWARWSRLRQLLRGYHKDKSSGNRNPRVLVFALYKKEAERLEHDLRNDGWDCASIHGNKAQSARTQALSDFRDGKCPLLVATDVAARGLDIPDVEAVINYTFPLTIEDYIHRIGRTGRAGKSGESHTFFQPGDKARAGELQLVLRQAGQTVPEELMRFGSTIKKKEHSLYGNFGPSSGGPPMKKATRIVFDD